MGLLLAKTYHLVIAQAAHHALNRSVAGCDALEAPVNHLQSHERKLWRPMRE